MKKGNSWFLKCEGLNGLQMSPNEYHKSLGAQMFKFDVYCSWPSWSVWHDLGRWLGGMFCEKMKFVVFEIRSLGSPTNVPK